MQATPFEHLVLIYAKQCVFPEFSPRARTRRWIDGNWVFYMGWESLSRRLFPKLAETWATRKTMHFHIRAIYANYCMKLKSFRGKPCVPPPSETITRKDTLHSLVIHRRRDNFCKSISFCAWNIKWSAKRYKACSTANTYANQFVFIIERRMYTILLFVPVPDKLFTFLF